MDILTTVFLHKHQMQKAVPRKPFPGSLSPFVSLLAEIKKSSLPRLSFHPGLVTYRDVGSLKTCHDLCVCWLCTCISFASKGWCGKRWYHLVLLCVGRNKESSTSNPFKPESTLLATKNKKKMLDGLPSKGN